jgi:hypothetical protein
MSLPEAADIFVHGRYEGCAAVPAWRTASSVVGHCRAALPLPESGDADEYRHENARSEIEEDNDAGKQGDQRCQARGAAQESRAGRHRHEVGRDDKSRWDEQDVLGIAT